jgi:hypothetical protein
MALQKSEGNKYNRFIAEFNSAFLFDAIVVGLNI